MDDQMQARLHNDMIGAMRARDTIRRDTLRLALNAVAEAAGRQHKDRLTDEEASIVLAGEISSRAESAASYRDAGRLEMAEAEEDGIALISSYLPAPFGEHELLALIDAGIIALEASGPQDLGRVMAWLGPRIQGRAEDPLTSSLVAQALA